MTQEDISEMYCSAYRILQSKNDADEAVSIALQRLRWKMPAANNPISYIKTCAKRAALSFLASRKARLRYEYYGLVRSLPGIVDDPERIRIARESVKIVYDSLRRERRGHLLIEYIEYIMSTPGATTINGTAQNGAMKEAHRRHGKMTEGSYKLRIAAIRSRLRKLLHA